MVAEPSEADVLADIPRAGYDPFEPPPPVTPSATDWDVDGSVIGPTLPQPNWDDNGAVIGPPPVRTWSSIANDYADIYSTAALTTPYAGPPQSFTAGQRTSEQTVSNIGGALANVASLGGYTPPPTEEEKAAAEAEFAQTAGSSRLSDADITRAYDVSSGAVGAGLKLPGRGVRPPAVIADAVDELTDPVKSLLTSIKEARPLEAQNMELLHKFRQRQAGAFSGALREGEEGFNAALGAMRGQADRIGFTPLRPLIGKEGVDELFTRLNSAGLRQFEHASAGHALRNVMDGIVPVPSELNQLERAFPGLSKALEDAGIIKGPGVAEYVRDLLSVPQSLKSAFDLSGYRQTATSAVAHPTLGIKGFAQSLKALASEGNYQQISDDLAGRWYRRVPTQSASGRTVYRDLMKDAGVAEATLDVGLTPTERTRIARFVNAIPGYRPTQRAYVTMLNVIRDGVFQMMLKGYGGIPTELPDETLRQWGRLINVTTGRGDLKDLQVLGNTVVGNDPVTRSSLFGTPIFWAPRLVLSRIQLPFELLSSNRQVQKEAARQMAAFLTVNSTIVGMGAAMGLWETELDPKSADFGQIKIKATGATGLPGAALGALGFGVNTYDGYQRIDPWAGFRPIANLLARLATGEVKSTTTGDTFDKAQGRILLDFLRTKFSPSFQIGASTLTGENAIGEEYGFDKFLEDAFLPLFLGDIKEALLSEDDSPSGTRPSRPRRPTRPSRPQRPSR